MQGETSCSFVLFVDHLDEGNHQRSLCLPGRTSVTRDCVSPCVHFVKGGKVRCPPVVLTCFCPSGVAVGWRWCGLGGLQPSNLYLLSVLSECRLLMTSRLAVQSPVALAPKRNRFVSNRPVRFQFSGRVAGKMVCLKGHSMEVSIVMSLSP